MVLVMYYKPTTQMAFDTVNFLIEKYVPFGWFFRNLHAAGANFFMAVVYMHILTGIYYNAYKRPREITWILGWLLYVLLILETVSGYVLPWGQLSYWATVVTTEMPTAFPKIGEFISLWMKGGYELGDVALGRFYSSHTVIYPVVMGIIIILHLLLVRINGISHPEGIEPYDKRTGYPFFPYVLLKEAGIAMFFMAIFLTFVFFYMHPFKSPDNFEPANPLSTPPHVAPEWYLLLYYEVFRSVPNKLLGVILFGLILFLLLLMPLLDFSPKRSARKRPLFFASFVLFLISAVALTVLGTLKPTPKNAYLGMFFTFLLLLFFVSLPVISILERREKDA